jgi:hypothetical protein
MTVASSSQYVQTDMSVFIAINMDISVMGISIMGISVMGISVMGISVSYRPIYPYL